MRSRELSALVSTVLAASVVAFACSSSSSGTAPPNGGSAGQAGTLAQGGSTAQGGSATQGGGAAPSGGTAQGGNTTVGGAGSAGQTGSAGSAGAAGGASVDACKSALFCDDFEAYAAGSPPGAPWGNSMNGGTVAVDATHVHSGARAVKLSGTGAGYRSAMMNLQKTAFLPPPGDVFYGRMMFWLDSAPTKSVHWTFIDGIGKVPGQAYRSVYRYGGQMPITNGADFVGSQLMANYDTPDSYAMPKVGPSSDCWQHSDKTVVPVGVWACAEWKFDGAANKMQFWLNGSEVTSLAMNVTGQGCVNMPGTQPWVAPSFEQIDLGWESYQADDAARSIWIDDVAISSQKIGCPE